MPLLPAAATQLDHSVTLLQLVSVPPDESQVE
jgi:hypothetical protein